MFYGIPHYGSFIILDNNDLYSLTITIKFIWTWWQLNRSLIRKGGKLNSLAHTK